METAGFGQQFLFSLANTSSHFQKALLRTSSFSVAAESAGSRRPGIDCV